MDCVRYVDLRYSGLCPNDHGQHVGGIVDGRHQQPGEYDGSRDYDADGGSPRSRSRRHRNLPWLGVRRSVGDGRRITFGATKVDEGCTIRLLARQLFAFGLRRAALALMCQDQRVADAMGVAGSPCPAPLPDGNEHLASAPGDPAPSQPLAVSASALEPAPVPNNPGGYILDLKHAEIDVPVQAVIHLAAAPAAPVSQQEQAWFDRASDVN
jgi:hypothetical protein